MIRDVSPCQPFFFIAREVLAASLAPPFLLEMMKAA
jgi:hypothetical protein